MDLSAEIRKGYPVSSEMKKVWQIQLDLLKRLLEVCQKYGLRVWGGGGTMLGAVRERGFIPWDDDIDVLLFRSDYDKLVSIAPKEFTHPYFFQCAYTDRDYINGHSQLRMDGTSAILAGQVAAGKKHHMGIFIDIFPYDAVPDQEDEMSRQITERNKKLLYLQHIVNGWDPFHPITSIFYCFKRKQLPQIYSQLEDLFREHSIEDNKNVSCFLFQVDPEHILQDKHWYDETLYLPFEDILMPIPKDYDKILSMQYGDYLTPRKCPTVHGSFWFLSADVPYEEYLAKHKREVRKMKWERFITRFKRIVFR